MSNVTLKSVIAAAYGLKEDYVSGPSWLESERFDIVAKAANPLSDAGLMQMLQTLLAERFKLTTHKDSKEISGYAIVIGKRGFKLKESDPASAARTNTGRGSLVAQKISLARLAEKLSGLLGVPVLDMTNRAGVFDIKLNWAPDDRQAPPPAEPSLFTALREQAGLQLESRKVPVDTLVVDHADRVPTEN